MSRLQTAAAMDVLPANQTIVKGMRGVAIDIQWVPGAEVAMEAMTHMVIFYRKLLNYQRVSLLTGPHCVDFRFLVCWVICCHAKLGGFHKPICGPTHFVELFYLFTIHYYWQMIFRIHKVSGDCWERNNS